MTELLLLALKLSVVVLVVAIGLGSKPAGLASLWRRPRLLVRSLLAMYVVVPVAVLLLARLLPMSAPVRTAVLVLAISAGAPLLPKKLMRLGREGYVFSLVVTSSLAAIVAVPLWAELIGALIGRESAVEPWPLAALLAKAFLAPLLVGMLLRYPLGAVADPLSERLLEIAGAILAAAGLGLLALHGGLLVDAGVGALVALLAMTLVALASGHLLGGPDAGERTALAVVCATRHVGIALLAAAAVPGPRTAAFVLAYLIASGVVTFVYLRARTRPEARSARPGRGISRPW